METPRFDASCKAKAPFMYDDPYDDDPLLKITSQPDGSKNIDYYLINEIRKTDREGNIKKRNSEEINKLIYERTFELGRQYYKQNYLEKENGDHN